MEVRFLLEKYKNIGYSQKRIKEIIEEVFKKNNIPLSKNEFEIIDTEVRVKISGVKRTHFILLKNKIEEEIKTTLTKEGLFVSSIF